MFFFLRVASVNREKVGGKQMKTTIDGVVYIKSASDLIPSRGHVPHWGKLISNVI